MESVISPQNKLSLLFDQLSSAAVATAEMSPDDENSAASHSGPYFMHWIPVRELLCMSRNSFQGSEQSNCSDSVPIKSKVNVFLENSQAVRSEKCMLISHCVSSAWARTILEAKLYALRQAFQLLHY